MSTPSTPIQPILLGTGPDLLSLLLSEDAWQGDAEFTISVDGVPIGGTQTIIASHALGEEQILDVQGDWGPGSHDVTVDFVNDAYGGTPQTDRNAYVDGASYDGTVAPAGTLSLFSDGPQSFVVGSAIIPAIQIGGGPDTLDLKVSEDAWQGDAEFTVSVDGVQIGGTLTALASHAAGAEQDVILQGDWGAGQHDVGITFLNDAWGGTPQSDRNLYLDAAAYDGIAFAATLSLLVDGTQSVEIGAPFPATLDIGSGADTLDVSVSEDAWQGDAEFTVSVDGVQIGGTLTAQASHAAGQSQDVMLRGDWAAGTHDVTVTFLNDAWGGSAATDRNLYVNSVASAGTVVAGSAALLGPGGRLAGSAAGLHTDGSAQFDLTLAPGPANPGAVSFAAGQYITPGNVLDYGGTQAWSVGAEIKVAAPAPGIGPDLPGGGAELVFGNTDGAPYAGYELWIDDGGELRVRIMSNYLAGQYVDVEGGTDVADGRMHFIGASYDGSGSAAGVTLYVDGRPDTSQVLSDSLAGPVASGGPLIIGNQLNGWQNQFELGGEMFNFALSGTARPQSWFAAGNANAPLVDAQTALAYDFATGSGTTIRDLSANGFTGTLSSAAMWQPGV